jgi:hypothetical protein
VRREVSAVLAADAADERGPLTTAGGFRCSSRTGTT